MKRWPTKPLGELLKVQNGFAFKSELFNENGKGLPIIRIRDLARGFSETFYEGEHDPAFEVESGDFLIGMDGEFRCYRWQGGKALLNQRVCRLQSFNRDLNAGYVFYGINDYLREIEDNTAFVTVKHLSSKQIASIEMSVPPLAEQERIVKLLDEADELRKLRAQADRRTAALVPSLFHEMFGQADFVEKTIGQFLEQGWLLLHKDGNHGSLYPRSSDFGIEGVPFLSATCVNDEGTIDHLKVKRLAEVKAKLLRHGWIEPGDVLLAHNASVGAVGFYDGDYDRAIIGTSLTVFRANPDRIEPRFLWASLRDVFFQDQLERIMKQALRNQVPITAQRKLSLRIPLLPLQREFAARVPEIRAIQTEQAASRHRLDELFQSLLHRAFNGEL